MQSGLQTPELMQASANDMVIVAELRDEALMDVILKKTDEFFPAGEPDEDRLGGISGGVRLGNGAGAVAGGESGGHLRRGRLCRS